jgi:hypothetical protein
MRKLDNALTLFDFDSMLTTDDTDDTDFLLSSVNPYHPLLN